MKQNSGLSNKKRDQRNNFFDPLWSRRESNSGPEKLKAYVLHA